MLTVSSWPVDTVNHLYSGHGRHGMAWLALFQLGLCAPTQGGPDLMDNVVAGAANTNIWPGLEHCEENRRLKYIQYI